jgi:dihydrofolate reductase
VALPKLIYITNVSLDGYIEDEHGRFDWTDAGQVHEFITELVRPMRTHLYGRRLYDTMSYWDGPVDTYPPASRAFAQVWQSAGKVVFSRTLAAAATSRTRVERDFDADAIRTLKRESASDIFIGGAELASQGLEADLVDECHLLVHPVIVGRGKPAFHPALRRNLELLETRRFDNGVVHLHYRVRASAS